MDIQAAHVTVFVSLFSSKGILRLGQRALTMFVGVVALRYQHHTKCNNSHKHSQSPLTRLMAVLCNS